MSINMPFGAAGVFSASREARGAEDTSNIATSPRFASIKAIHSGYFFWSLPQQEVRPGGREVIRGYLLPAERKKRLQLKRKSFSDFVVFPKGEGNLPEHNFGKRQGRLAGSMGKPYVCRQLL